VDQLNSFGVDLSFKRCRDKHISFLGDPNFTGFDRIAGFFGFFLVDCAILVGDAHQEVRVDAIGLAEGVGGLVFAIPTGHTGNFTAKDLDEPDGCVLGNVTEALDGCHRGLGVHLEMFHGFAHGVDDTKAGGFSAAERTATADRFAGDHAGGVLTNDLGIFVHHPTHHLGGGAYVRGGDIEPWTDIFPKDAHIFPYQALFFTDRQGGRIHHDTTFAATQGNVCHGTFPGHPHG